MTTVTPRRRWTTQLVEQAIRAYVAKHGQPPKHEHLGTEGLPYSRTLERLYGTESFTKATAAAGYTPRGVGQPAKRHGIRAAA